MKKRLCVLGPLVVGLITPSLVIFFLEGFVEEISPLVSAQNILSKQFAWGHNLFLLALIGGGLS